MLQRIASVAALLAAFVNGNEWGKEFTHDEISSLNAPRLFESWAKAFDRVYQHDEEKLHHFQIWLQNLEKIAKHNSDNSQTFKMRMNQFGDMTEEDFNSYIHGGEGKKCYNGDKSKRKLLKHEGLAAGSVNANPTSVDWTTKGVVTPVKNQGSCGSCWSFSATGATECNYAIKNGQLNSLSEQQLMDCSYKDGNLGCSGGLMDNAFKYIESNGGLCTEAEYPYEGKDGTCNSAKCGTFYDAITTHTDVTIDSETALETAVASGCVSVAIEADQSAFQFYSSGVLSGKCGTSTDHGVLVVGYGTTGTQDYWKVKNSWGTTWGEAGYVLICKSCETSNGNKGECGIYTDPSYPVAK